MLDPVLSSKHVSTIYKIKQMYMIIHIRDKHTYYLFALADVGGAGWPLGSTPPPVVGTVVGTPVLLLLVAGGRPFALLLTTGGFEPPPPPAI